jgi:CRP-like cAMP-binding protein
MVRADRRLSQSPSHRGGNRLLALLTDEDSRALKRHLYPVKLKTGQTLLTAHAPVKHVYFVSEGLVSLVQLMQNGKLTGTAIIGREGMVGALAPLGAAACSHEAVVQIEGIGLRMSAEVLRREMALRPALRDVLFLYVQALFLQVAQSVACNNQHLLQSRLARWLSMAADCTEAEDLPLTHELLSIMLGVRRSGVTQGLAALKSQGLIALRHGGVRIAHRSALRAEACECYGLVSREFRRILGVSVFQTPRGKVWSRGDHAPEHAVKS